MSIKEKIQATVAKYGLTFRGFALGTLIFPPAALYVGWKMPNLTWVTRGILVILALVIPGVLPLVVGAPLYYLYTLIFGHSQ